MSTAIERARDVAELSRASGQEAWRFAQALATAQLLPKEYRDKPGNVLLAMEYGRALRLPVATIFTSVHVIDGRPSMSAELMQALIRREGHRIRVTGDLHQASCAIVRKDDPEFTYTATFTLEDAQRAELLKLMPDGSIRSRGQSGKATGWEKYPKSMLLARAVSACARQACADVLAGVSYVPEELGEAPDLEELEALVVTQQASSAPPSASPAAPSPAPVGDPAPESAEAISEPPADEHPPRTDDVTPSELDMLTGQLDQAVQAQDLERISALAVIAGNHGLEQLVDEARAQWFDVRDALVQQESQRGQG